MRSSFVYFTWAACLFMSVITQYSANITLEWWLHIDTLSHEQWLYLRVLLTHAHVVRLQELIFAIPCIILYPERKVDSLLAWHCQNYRLYQKMVQIKVVKHWILYKKVSGRMSVSHRSGAKRKQRLQSLKYYYNVLKWESRFTLGLDAAKNTHYIKTCFK